MSAWSRLPMDFADFARSQGFPGHGDAFLPRRLYREYLVATLTRVRRSGSNCSIEVVPELATALFCSADREKPMLVGLHHGSHLEADHVVLAIGPPRTGLPWPSHLASFAAEGSLVADPWAPGALDRIPPDATVLFIGTGLTMVDIVLSLASRGHRGRLVGRSRHGLLPLAQRSTPSAAIESSLDPAPTSARELFRAVRVAVEKVDFDGGDWRAVIAGVRAQLPTLWPGLSLDERQRLLRHAQRYWEVHRHRMAPDVATTLHHLVGVGVLEVDRGHLVALERKGARFLASLEGPRSSERLEADVVVNCTGPAPTYSDSSRLVGRLLEAGIACPDPGGLGLLVDEHGDLCAVDGRANDRIHTLGWPRRGRTYESSGIPEIRLQACVLAERIRGGR
jgi:uncharacterized NAD(P)/FAD-binding protein YdhS